MKKNTVLAILMVSAIALSACGEGGSSTSYSGNNASSTIEASSELDSAEGASNDQATDIQTDGNKDTTASSSEGEKNKKGRAVNPVKNLRIHQLHQKELLPTHCQMERK